MEGEESDLKRNRGVSLLRFRLVVKRDQVLHKLQRLPCIESLELCGRANVLGELDAQTLLGFGGL